MAAVSGNVIDPVRHLIRVAAPSDPGSPTVSGVCPSTPLSDASLLTNAAGEPNMGAVIRGELESADEVDLWCAFVKWHELRMLKKQLEGHASEGSSIFTPG